MQPFKGGGVLEENPLFGALTTSDHDSHRSGKADGTRATDDNNGNGHFDGKNTVFANRHPSDECDYGDGKNGRYKNSRYLIGSAGNWCFSSVGVFNKLYNFRQSCICANRRNAEAKSTGGVDGAGGYGITEGFFYRNAFTREGAFINRRGATHNNPVHGNTTARANFYNVIHTQRACSNRCNRIAIDTVRCLWCERQKLGDGVAGVILGTCFEVFANSD